MQEAVMIDMRKRIIEAAITVAAQSGFTQATTKEIAREADCSEGIIYHYFTSKHEKNTLIFQSAGRLPQPLRSCQNTL